mgnify:CR=1 FL=1
MRRRQTRDVGERIASEESAPDEVRRVTGERTDRTWNEVSREPPTKSV